jgi:hypothetical protein
MEKEKAYPYPEVKATEEIIRKCFDLWVGNPIKTDDILLCSFKAGWNAAIIYSQKLRYVGSGPDSV